MKARPRLGMIERAGLPAGLFSRRRSAWPPSDKAH